MNTLFTINFRREAYLQEVARVRSRVISLAVWVAYFGMLAVLLGLYVLNCSSLAERTTAIERQAARLRSADASHAPAQLRTMDLDQIEHNVQNIRQWRDRLRRLAIILPPNARITALAVNPQNLPGIVAQNALVVTGELRAPASQDRMQAVMRIVTALRDDKAFKGYTAVRLASTQVTQGGLAEFVIECR